MTDSSDSSVFVDRDVQSKEELIARCAEMIRAGTLHVSLTVMPDHHVIATSMGIDQRDIPNFLRHSADFVERELRRAELQAQRDAIPAARKCVCPACDNEVALAATIPEEKLNTVSGKRAMCICSCGAFLVPGVTEGALTLRLCTEEEIAGLPDEVRTRMVRVRRDLARIMRDDEAN